MATLGTKPKRRSSDEVYHDQGKLHALQIMLCTRLDELLNVLEVRFSRSNRLYVGCCPIHGGNNPEALNLYRHGDRRPGVWTCNTRACHDKMGGFGKTILGFVRGILSRKRCGWQDKKNKQERAAQRKYGWRETVDWCCEFLGTTIEAIEVDYVELEKVQYAAGMSVITKQPKQEKTGLLRSNVRKHLVFPAKYYLDRGYSREVLDRYDVGLYPVKGKELSGRVCVPVYDNDYRFVLGFTGRSVHEKCGKCEKFHDHKLPCPTDEHERKRASKWWNTLNRDEVLYNFWFAQKEIADSGVVVLVEGPGDVWKLEMAGIHCSVALMGLYLSDQQQVILESSGARNVIVLVDSDDGGDVSREKLKEKLGLIMRLHFVKLSRKDVGEMPVEQIQSEILPLITRLKERGY